VKCKIVIMDDENQPPPLFPDEDSKDNDEDLFASSSAVCDVNCYVIIACESLGGRGRPA